MIKTLSNQTILVYRHKDVEWVFLYNQEKDFITDSQGESVTKNLENLLVDIQEGCNKLAIVLKSAKEKQKFLVESGISRHPSFQVLHAKADGVISDMEKELLQYTSGLDQFKELVAKAKRFDALSPQSPEPSIDEGSILHMLESIFGKNVSENLGIDQESTSDNCDCANCVLRRKLDSYRTPEGEFESIPLTEDLMELLENSLSASIRMVEAQPEDTPESLKERFKYSPRTFGKGILH